MNYSSNFCLIHPILLIYFLLTSFYFQTSRSGSGKRDFRLMRRLSPLWISIFKGLETSYFFEGMKKLEECWTKSVEVEGDYVDK